MISGAHTMRRAFASSAAVILILALPGVSSCAQAKERWTAISDSEPPSVQISKKAIDGRTVFLGGCNRLLGAGLTGTFSSYQGNALLKSDDQSEPVTFEIAGKAGTTRFAGSVHYYAAEKSWVITGLLPPAFVDAFGHGDVLTVRNGNGEAAFKFDLPGSARAAKTMQEVCGFESPPSAPASALWNAMSTTAISITGDIRITAEEIRFENGASLRLAKTDRPGVMRVAEPGNPVLKNGNLLCGWEPPTYVVLGREKGTESLDGSSTLYLKIHNGQEIPPSSDAIGMESEGRGLCAIYNFTEDRK